MAARNSEGRADGVGERDRWRPSRAARPEDTTSSATESRAMTEKTSARRGSSRVCARRQDTAAARATERCAAVIASAAAKQRSWRPSSFAWSLTFDVRVEREHRLLPMASARHLQSHSRRELWASLAGDERLLLAMWARLARERAGTRSRSRSAQQEPPVSPAALRPPSISAHYTDPPESILLSVPVGFRAKEKNERTKNKKRRERDKDGTTLPAAPFRRARRTARMMNTIQNEN